MNRRDLHNSIFPVISIPETAIAAAGNTDAAAVIDLQNYNGFEAIARVELSAAGTVQLVIREGDMADGSDQAVVADTGDLILNTGDDLLDHAVATSGVLKVGYVGLKRYVSCRLVAVGGAVAGTADAIGIRHDAKLEGNTADNNVGNG